MGNGLQLSDQQKPFRLYIRHSLSPGDVLVMTAAIESLHKAYPGEYLTNVETTCPAIWDHNPHINRDVLAYRATVLHLEYPLIHQCGSRQVHFAHGFCEDLGRKIGRPVPLLVNKPSLYLDEDERTNRLPGTEDIGPYIVGNFGHKRDFTAKWAGSELWQEVVDALRDRVTFVQVGESNPSHHHPPIAGAVNLIGKTKPRDLFRLVHHSIAATGPVTFLHHVAAALGKGYVCCAGGREDQTWEAYNTTVYLHTLGQLDCCEQKACWKSRTVALGDGGKGDKSLCKYPVQNGRGEWVPKCLQLVGSRGVVAALEQLLTAKGLRAVNPLEQLVRKTTRELPVLRT